MVGQPSRSVNDFETADGLRNALKSKEAVAAFADVGRDFPRSLVGYSLAQKPDEDSISETSSFHELDGDLDWVLTNYNAEISQTQSLQEELKRLQVLRSYLILDSEREPAFERLTALASRMFRVPIALVSLVDLGRQWFMSNRGLGDVRETPRKLAFCAHAILAKEDLLIVPDASVDPRFMDNPLVTGPPNIRFYAGSPLMCPEGFKLGTLCIIDSTARPEGLSLEEKQNLRELANLIVDAMVERKREKLRVLQDKSQIIACTAHDLLTPLSGVQMSLSLLLDDDELKNRLSADQRELIVTAASCSEVMNRICSQAIESFRGDVAQHNEGQGHLSANKADVGGPKPVIVHEIMKNLQMVMEPYPKSVPLYISVDPKVPPKIITDDLKVFRSALNFLTNACKKTKKGSVHLQLYVSGKKTKSRKLVFECEDTGPGVPMEVYPFLFRPFREDDVIQGEMCMRLDADGNVRPGMCSTMNNSGLGLYSVASQISSIGGDYGFRPRGPHGNSTSGSKPEDKEATGSIFWFSIPLHVPTTESVLGGKTSSSTTVAELPFKHDDSFMLDQDDDMKPFKAPPPRNASFSLPTVQIVPSCSDLHMYEVEQLARQAEERVKDIHAYNAKRMREPDEYLPVTEVRGEEMQNDTTMAVHETKVRVRKALVIDDSLVIRKSLSRALSKLGFEVEVAVNGMEGLKTLQKEVFDVVLCDFLMPIMDGLDCVQQYREWEEKHRPWFQQYIIGISAHASPNDAEKGLAVGMNDFKIKPLTLKVLKELESCEELKRVSEALDHMLSLDSSEKSPADIEIKDHDLEPMESARHSDDTSGPTCLIGEDSSNVSKLMARIMEGSGWKTVVVDDGEDALRLLKVRNWHAVFLDEEMPRLTGIRCAARFREWEKENRIAKQNNMFLLSDSFVPNPSNGCVSAAFPIGFDGVLGKPILPKDLRGLLQLAAQRITVSSESCDIVSR